MQGMIVPCLRNRGF